MLFDCYRRFVSETLMKRKNFEKFQQFRQLYSTSKDAAARTSAKTISSENNRDPVENKSNIKKVIKNLNSMFKISYLFIS